MAYSIYTIHSSDNELMYIGCTQNFRARKSLHLTGPCGKMHNWINTLEETNKPIFKEIEIIEDKKQAFAREKFLIQTLQPKLNTAHIYIRTDKINKEAK
jgi:predicted GIY-YIG superfamily endonuclease